CVPPRAPLSPPDPTQDAVLGRSVSAPRRAGTSFAEGTGNTTVASARVRPAVARALCAGHFPSDPLLPGAALLLGRVETHTGRTLACTGIDAGLWPWPRLLEGTAQAAGLLAGLQPGGRGSAAVIAEYRDVALGVERHRGRVGFEARLERRLAHFWRSR